MTDTDTDSGADTEIDADVGADAEAGRGASGDRARESVEHLQAAARELIAAARAALDVAEDLVDDPEVATSLAGAVGSFGDVVRNLAVGWRSVAGPASNGRRAGDAAGGPDDDGPEPPDSGVERIPIT